VRRHGLAVVVLAGCAELGAMSDGTSISVGKPNQGYLIEGARLPDHGAGFTTREVWIKRGNRYGTDELVDLVTGVARRMRGRVKDVKLVIADLSSRGGGGSFAFHRSHQSGRDADLVPYLRDADGKPFEPDAMHKLDARGRATDGSGVTLDVPRTWLLVKELLAAPEAPVQYIFMYEPLVQMLLEHAKKLGEPEPLIAKARKALRQPGDSARHDDHMHVRVYCSDSDREYGCIDIGPMELLAERQAEQRAELAVLATPLPPPAASAAPGPDTTLRAQLETERPWGTELWTGETAADLAAPDLAAISKLLLRAR
jgi:penicillin-insensitive murein DD-endopeptidase